MSDIFFLSFSTKFNRLASCSGLFVLICLLPVSWHANAGTNNLPDIGSSAGSLISLEKEKRLGDEFMRSVRQSLNIIEDPLSNDYIQALGLKLASQIETNNQSFNFFIIDDPAINAFAGPGGHIGIHAGLIRASNTESELASVMAHEIAHVVQRHLVRQFESGKNFSIATMGALIAAILLGKNSPEIGEAVLASTIAGNIQQQLGFSRSNEQEADRVGMEMLVNAQFDAHGMADFFETLQTANRYNQTGAPEFIMTHPVTASRIADTRGRAKQLVKRPRQPGTQLNYKLFVARLGSISRSTSSSSNEKIKNHLATVKPHEKDFASRYRQILLLAKTNQPDTALGRVSSLAEDDSYRIPYFITQAELEISTRDIKQAVRTLEHGLQLHPQNRSLSILYASTLLGLGKSKQAMQVLQPFVRQNNIRNAKTYRLYAKAAKTAGFSSEAYEALADYHQVLGQYHTAIQQLKKAALQNDTDDYRRSRIQARIDSLKAIVLNNQSGTEKEGHKPE